ncbi:hypothetical protein SUGI_1187650 [Cryptomeria japonica]|nr:hypothetical protein SUGI_1187650 [Cryptomeria japonica]
MGRLGMLCFGMMMTTMMIIQVEGDGNQMFRVGGLDAWALPTNGRPDLYEKWAADIKFKIGDALLFLYPPSQDLVVQVKEEAYAKCDISSPITTFNDGNSYFSFNYSGYFYFTSGRPGNCAKSQKLAIAVADSNGALPPLPSSSVNGYLGISPDTAIASMPAASATSGANLGSVIVKFLRSFGDTGLG